MIYIALGGAVGALTRYGLVLLTHKLLGQGMPYGTLAVNIIGSLILGLLFAPAAQKGSLTPLQIGIAVGFLGALTTFSTFSFETHQLMFVQQQFWKAAATILANVTLCIGAIGLGGYLSKWI